MTPEEKIRDITFGVLHQFASDVMDDLHQKLDNAYPPASKPGEVPRRRSGELQEGIDYLITQEGSLIVLTIISSAPHSAYLEFGTDRMSKRPFMLPALQSWTPELIRRLQAAFSGPSPVVSPAGAIIPFTNIAA